MPKIYPWNASAMGSVFEDAPGNLREWGWTNTMFLATSASVGAAFCSGTGSTGSEYAVLPALTAGQTLNIFGMQAVTANDGASDANVMQMALNVTDGDGNNALQKNVMAATAKGPWFQFFELPLKIHGPARVSVIPVGSGVGGGTTNFNYVTIQYIIVDESDHVVS
mgnify:FL=1